MSFESLANAAELAHLCAVIATPMNDSAPFNERADAAPQPNPTMNAPRNIGRGLFAVALSALSTLSLSAANFTILKSMLDTRNGYIDFAAASIDGYPVNLQPGDTIFIEPHTRAQIVISRVTQGTSANPITITNAATGQFIIDTTNTATKKGITLAGCHDVVLKGTDVFDPVAETFNVGIKIARTPSGASGITVTQHGDNSHPPITGSYNFELKDIEIAGTGFAGVHVKCDLLPASSGFVMTNVKIHDLDIHDTGGEGLYIGASDFATVDRHQIHGLEIYRNVITNAGWDGIQVGCATQDASIHDNRIVGYGLLAGTDIYQDEGIRANPGTKADIYNNFIAGDPAYAGTGIFADPYGSIKIYNNVIVSPGERGIYLHESDNAKGYTLDYAVEMFNNTIVTPSTYGVEFQAGRHSKNNRWVNNIVAAPGTAYRQFQDAPILQDATNTEVASVAAVGFLNAANFKYRLPPANAAVNSGTNVSALGVTVDYDNVTRPQGTGYDRGAFEHGILYSVANITSDASLAAHLDRKFNDYTHKINLNASSEVTVNGVKFGYGTGNGSGTQSAKNYTLTSFSYTDTTFNSSATGDIHTVLATRGTNTNSATYTLTLNALTPGERYTFVLFNDSSHSAGRGWYRVSQNIDSTTYDVDFSAGGVGSSRALAVNYTATSTSVTFTFARRDGVGTTNSSSWIGFAGFVNYVKEFN